METKRLTVDEIVDMISTRYNVYTRSFIYDDEDKIESCAYNGRDGNMCAFALMVKDDVRHRLKEYENADYNIALLGEDIIKEEYAEYPVQFYMDIQHLHDTSDYWNSKGLTDQGQEFANEIKKKYNGK